MSARMLTMCSALACVSLASLGGCPTPGTRTCNQGCSNPTQVTTKIMNDQLGSLNPDDLQVLADLAMEQTGVQLPLLTDEQAAAVITFLQDNGIQTVADLQALIQRAQEDPNAVVISDEVRRVLDDIAADPSAYTGAAEQLGQEFEL